MALLRRIRRFCGGCDALLVRREGESVPKFLTRKTCNKECQILLKEKKRNNGSSCFCGNPRNIQNAPYCSWEHRLIAIKCKRWGFEPNLQQYEEHSSKLNAVQKEIEMSCRNAPEKPFPINKEAR